MSFHTLRGHFVLVVAALAGVIGMGTVFSGVMHGNIHTVLQGVAPLLIGLWWAGHELGKSMSESAARRSARGQVESTRGRSRQ